LSSVSDFLLDVPEILKELSENLNISVLEINIYTVKESKKEMGIGILAVIESKIFCLPVSYKKYQRLKYTKLLFCQLYCMDAKIGLSR